ncbi:MAG: hypothetical protein ABJL67_04145 [Sulfitobacter sp.]
MKLLTVMQPIGLVLILSACATPPAKVQPLEVSSSQYDRMNCKQLRESEGNWSQNVETLSEQQEKARAGDTIGVILIGIPASSLAGGDVETQLAQAKGHVKTIQSVIVRKSC